MRVFDRLLALVLGLAAIALAVVIITEVVRTALGMQPWLVHLDTVTAYLTMRTWQDLPVRLALGGLTAAGFLLLGSQLWPRRRRFTRLAPVTNGIDSVAVRTSLRNAR
ncbi:hypothetical protein [Fodinicola feengrottensis]|uniref:Uncharacterized protein n=1 Tax=Fodinicola feengrottensis TaxID=435914 RepID=A0ABN2I0W8_9ACTN|nr:hypothetical protein [Fodinicola feengrottensis]